ncbi:MAG: tyrosine-type recombinase/integrase [Thiohalomonadales bacterium]
MSSHTSNFPGITSRTSKSIQLCIPYKGKKIYETLALNNTKPNRRFAYNLRCEVIQALKSGVFNYQNYFKGGKNEDKFAHMSGDTINIESRLDDYLKTLLIRIEAKTLKRSTLTGYKRHIESLSKTFGHMKLSSLTKNDLKKWAKNKNVKQKTITNQLPHLRAIIDTALDNDQISNNVLYQWSPKSKVKTKKILKNPFTLNEFRQIMDSVKIICPDIYNLVLFRFSLGMRPCEIFGLRWARYDEINKSITIMETIVDGHIEKTPKTESSIRTLELNKSALLSINAQKKETYGNYDYVFINKNTGKPWRYDAISRRWKAALNHAEVNYRRPYNTRHTFATLSLKSNELSLYEVSRALGHSDIITTSKSYIGNNGMVEIQKTGGNTAIFSIENSK